MKFAPLALALIATPAFATDCAFHRDEAPRLDLDGITQVEVAIGADELNVQSGTTPRLGIRTCASSEAGLDERAFKVTRSGSRLRIEPQGTAYQITFFASQHYQYAKLDLVLPAEVQLKLDVGSGEVAVRGMRRLDIDLGSGDADVDGVGVLKADVGSGDLRLGRIGAANLDVGSGDVHSGEISGELHVSVGSGDVNLASAGPLTVNSVGSGDLEVTRVNGNVALDSLGSGSIVLREVNGNVIVDDIGSGNLELSGVNGDLQVWDEDDLESIHHRGVRGRVVIGS